MSFPASVPRHLLVSRGAHVLAPLVTPIPLDAGVGLSAGLFCLVRVVDSGTTAENKGACHSRFHRTGGSISMIRARRRLIRGWRIYCGRPQRFRPHMSC